MSSADGPHPNGGGDATTPARSQHHRSIDRLLGTIGTPSSAIADANILLQLSKSTRLDREEHEIENERNERDTWHTANVLFSCRRQIPTPQEQNQSSSPQPPNLYHRPQANANTGIVDNFQERLIAAADIANPPIDGNNGRYNTNNGSNSDNYKPAVLQPDIFRQTQQSNLLPVWVKRLYKKQQKGDYSHVRELVPYPTRLPQLNITYLCDKCKYINQTYNQNQPLNFELTNCVQIGVSTYGFVLQLHTTNNETDIGIQSGDIIYNIYKCHPHYNDLCDDIDESTRRSLSNYMLETAPRPLNITVIRRPEKSISHNMDKLTWHHPEHHFKLPNERQYEGIREIYHDKEGVSLEELDSKIDNDWRMENDGSLSLSSMSEDVQGINSIDSQSDITSSSSSSEEEEEEVAADEGVNFDVDDGGFGIEDGNNDESGDGFGGGSDRIDSPSSSINNEERGDNDEPTDTVSNEVVVDAYGRPRLRKKRKICADNFHTELTDEVSPFYYEEELQDQDYGLVDSLDDMINRTNLQYQVARQDGARRRHSQRIASEGSRLAASNPLYQPPPQGYDYDGIRPELQSLPTERLLQRPCIGDDGGLAPELLALWRRNMSRPIAGGQHIPFRLRGERGRQQRADARRYRDTRQVTYRSVAELRSSESRELTYGSPIMAPWNNDNGDPEMLRSVVYKPESNGSLTVECWEDDLYRKRKVCTSQELSQDPWPTTTESDDEEEARLNEMDNDVDREAAIENKKAKHYYEHEFKSKKRKMDIIDTDEDPDWSGCKRRRCTYDFDIPKILEQEEGGDTAARRYNRKVFWKKNDTRTQIRLDMSNVGTRQPFFLLGHVYKLETTPDADVVIGRCRSHSKRSRWKCGAWFRYDRQQYELEMMESHCAHCSIKRLFEMNTSNYCQEHIKAVVHAYVNYWERSYDPHPDSWRVPEVWHPAIYIKTFMNDEQVLEIIKAARVCLHNPSHDQFMKIAKLISLGNDVEGGLRLNPDMHYFYSTWGRVISVKDGDLKILGGVCSRPNQRLMVRMECIHPDDQSVLRIQFKVADIISKFFKEERHLNPTKVSSYLTTDHISFTLREDNFQMLRNIPHRINSSCKKKNTKHKQTPNDDNWHQLRYCYRGERHYSTCVCGDAPSNTRQVIRCSTCRFIFHLECLELLSPPERGWRCNYCIKETDEDEEKRDRASLDWLYMMTSINGLY